MLLDEIYCADQLQATELRLVLASRSYEGSVAELEDQLHAIEDALEARLAELDFEHPIAWLRRRLGLTTTEERAIWLVAGCELSPRIRELARSLATEQVLEPTIDVIRRVVYGGATAVACREIEPRARVFALRLLERAEGGEVPVARQTVRIAERVIRLVHGERDLDAELAEVAVRAETTELAQLAVPVEAVRAVAATLGGQSDAVTMIVGGRGTGRRSIIEACARCAEREALVIDGANLTADVRLVRAILREAMLLDRVLVLRNLDAVGPAARAETFGLLNRELVKRMPGPIFVTCSEALRLRWSRPTTVVELGPLSEGQRAAVWQHALPEAPPATTAQLAARHPMAPGLVHAAAAAARAQVGSAAVDQAAVASGIRIAIDDGLAGLATRIAPTQTWDDLVLPEDQLAVITELLARASNRHQVYEQWGFAAKVGRGLGISALFSGPPGTGKTMVAGLIARELGLELYQVDVAKMVSKWVGETEKNLAALFDAAEAGHAVLLFDEADSLFGKRTAVSSANDRYANLEVNYLLQRMESFTGISVLTTNHEQAIDEAFRRRLALHVRFPVPEVAERARIWRAMLPDAAEVDDGVDFSEVARRFEMTGGYIKNAVLRAAFLAAAERTAISMRHVEYAAHVEYEAMGKIAPRAALS